VTRRTAPAAPADPRTCVVVATRNRRDELRHTLARLTTLPEGPAVTVVDNASTDGTAGMVRTEFPAVRLLVQRRNLGATARNIGVAAAAADDARYVAFSDDDSWWQPGALRRAADLLDHHPRLGAVAARTVIAPDDVPDPVNEAMADSPLAAPGPPADLPGPRVLGFLGCAVVVRRTAFEAAGGFHPLLFFVGEERLLAYDLTAAGWPLAYADTVVAVHRPSAARPEPGWRDRLEARNEVLTAWLRRPLPVALARTARLARTGLTDTAARAALGAAVLRLPRALLARRTLPADVESDVTLLEGTRP
jgi:GT2 family glycosyltransferase